MNLLISRRRLTSPAMGMTTAPSAAALASSSTAGAERHPQRAALTHA
jgi:hypothetical protein